MDASTATPPLDESNDSTATKVLGGIIGGALGLALIAALLSCLFIQRRKRQLRQRKAAKVKFQDAPGPSGGPSGGPPPLPAPPTKAHGAAPAPPTPRHGRPAR